MTDAPDRAYWRVGYHADPAGFVPLELSTFNHRFDDVQRRFRSIYVAELAETALREVLADVVFEGRGQLEIVAEPVALTDPAPPALQTVCAGWRLALEHAVALVDRE